MNKNKLVIKKTNDKNQLASHKMACPTPTFCRNRPMFQNGRLARRNPQTADRDAGAPAPQGAMSEGIRGKHRQRSSSPVLCGHSEAARCWTALKVYALASGQESYCFYPWEYAGSFLGIWMPSGWLKSSVLPYSRTAWKDAPTESRAPPPELLT